MNSLSSSALDNNKDLFISLKSTRVDDGLLDYMKEYLELDFTKIDILLNFDLYIRFKEGFFLTNVTISKNKKTGQILPSLDKVVLNYSNCQDNVSNRFAQAAFNQILKDKECPISISTMPNTMEEFVLGIVVNKIDSIADAPLTSKEKVKINEIMLHCLFKNKESGYDLDSFWNLYNNVYQIALEKNKLEVSISNPIPISQNKQSIFKA